MKEKIKEKINKEMEKNDLKYLANKEELIKEIYNRFCRDCQLKNECNICKVVEKEIEEKLKEKIGEKNID